MIPQQLLTEIDAVAKMRGESRSRFLQRVLSEVIRASSDAKIRQRINALFEDDEIARVQRQGAEELESIKTRWANESW